MTLRGFWRLALMVYAIGKVGRGQAYFRPSELPRPCLTRQAGVQG